MTKDFVITSPGATSDKLGIMTDDSLFPFHYRNCKVQVSLRRKQIKKINFIGNKPILYQNIQAIVFLPAILYVMPICHTLVK